MNENALLTWNDPAFDGWLECIPNVSEGRNLRLLEEFAAAIQSVPGVHLLHQDANADAHRTVYTFVGPAEAVVEAALQLYAAVAERLDLRQHAGAHPRQGAVDVCPLVPLGTTSWEVAQEAARNLGRRLAEELQLGGWFYEKNATRPERRLLANLRRGGYEALGHKAADPAWVLDFGTFRQADSFGATVLGARPFLIAYNFTLSSNLQLNESKSIASLVRESIGGLKGVRAIGWWMEGYRRAQVSCNLTDTFAVSAKEVFDAVSAEANRLGGTVEASELIGLIPAHGLRGFAPLEEAVSYLKLDGHGPFDLNGRLLENLLNTLPR
jgi:glutamate formiminotransferase/formiminotetrahydrofolate cyclodeaminase